MIAGTFGTVVAEPSGSHPASAASTRSSTRAGLRSPTSTSSDPSGTSRRR